jgi:hypothetical protein
MRPAWLGGRSLLVLVVLGTCAGGVLACSTGRPASAGYSGVVTVDVARPGAVIPTDFLGLSFEASVLSSDLLDPARSNLPVLMRDLGTGRLRFGGNSLDRVTAWTADPQAQLPVWAHSRVTPADLAHLGALTAATGWDIDLGVTLGHPDPAVAADEAAAAAHLIGSRLGTVQIGNEPDLLTNVRPGYDTTGYGADVGAYRVAIAAAAPTAGLSGPDTAGPTELGPFAAEEGGGLRLLTQHFYPLTRCGGARPTIDQLLSPSTRQAEASVADAAVAVGRTLGLAVRIDETNSASCGGQDGVSNTLASALWMVEYLVTVAQHGVAGVGVQGGLAACRGYTPLCVPGATGAAAGTAPGIDPIADASLGAAAATDGRLAAQPEFYGLLLMHELEGARWLTLTTNHALAVWEAAAAMPDGSVRVVIVNPSSSAVADITVRAPGYGGQASVQWLTGPSLAATSGIRLGGAEVGADGAWRPRPDTPLPGVGADRVDLPPATAALVTLTVGP